MVFGRNKQQPIVQPAQVVPLAATNIGAPAVGLTNVTLAQPALLAGQQQTTITQTALPIATSQTSVQTTALPIAQQTTTIASSRQFLAGSHETVTLAPIIDQHVRVDKIIEVQPVIHRETQQEIINHIEQHVTQAPAPSLMQTVTLQPVIQETVISREVDEITPVIHREVAQSVVERVEEHLQERVVAPVQHVNQVIQEKTIIQQGQAIPAFQAGGGIPMATVTGPDLNRNGIPDQLEPGMMGRGLNGLPLNGSAGALPLNNGLNNGLPLNAATAGMPLNNGLPLNAATAGMPLNNGLGAPGFAPGMQQPGFAGQQGFAPGMQQPGFAGQQGMGMQQGFAGSPMLNQPIL